ncbi:MAG: ORF6N domain-containing protein [Candidatus Omnitrophota bacterium]
MCPVRSPKEFMFQLTDEEWKELVPIWHQFKTRKHSYILPFAFTEHDVAMLSSVLNRTSVNLLILKTRKTNKIAVTSRVINLLRLKGWYLTSYYFYMAADKFFVGRYLPTLSIERSLYQLAGTTGVCDVKWSLRR